MEHFSDLYLYVGTVFVSGIDVNSWNLEKNEFTFVEGDTEVELIKCKVVEDDGD